MCEVLRVFDVTGMTSKPSGWNRSCHKRSVLLVGANPSICTKEISEGFRLDSVDNLSSLCGPSWGQDEMVCVNVVLW